jgi:hypothetical protein
MRDVARTILWRRLDRPGHEAARLERVDEGWRLSGECAVGFDGKACGLSYAIGCDPAWRSVSCRVSGFVGSEPVSIEIRREDSGRWTMNGAPQPQVDGCIDLDLNFSPSTNLLPIRRLGLAVGAGAPVRAAWLRFPSFRLEILEQVYVRTADRSYRYESAGGSFTADLRVDAHGFVTRYAGLFEEVAA